MAISESAAAVGLRLQTNAVASLAEFEALLLDRAMAMGLVAEADRDRLTDRHILDSLRAATLFRPEDRLAYDLGSGAGLPGIVLAIVVPECRFVLVEPKERAAGFLELAVDRMELSNVDVVTQRVEDLDAAADVATARAFAPLARSWEAGCRLLRPGGRLIYFAGGDFDEATVRTVTNPEPPADVRLEAVIEKASPLVIMTRGT